MRPINHLGGDEGVLMRLYFHPRRGHPRHLTSSGSDILSCRISPSDRGGEGVLMAPARPAQSRVSLAWSQLPPCQFVAGSGGLVTPEVAPRPLS